MWSIETLVVFLVIADSNEVDVTGLTFVGLPNRRFVLTLEELRSWPCFERGWLELGAPNTWCLGCFRLGGWLPLHNLPHWLPDLLALWDMHLLHSRSNFSLSNSCCTRTVLCYGAPP